MGDTVKGISFFILIKTSSFLQRVYTMASRQRYKSKTMKWVHNKTSTQLQSYNLDQLLDMLYSQKRLVFNLMITSFFINGILLGVLIRCLTH